jgi:hypothetical protein
MEMFGREEFLILFVLFKRLELETSGSIEFEETRRLEELKRVGAVLKHTVGQEWLQQQHFRNSSKRITVLKKTRLKTETCRLSRDSER